jgi:hypothetical protein
MFSTFARILDLGRGQALSKHNQHASNAGYVVHHGRPRLVCRWRLDPATRKPLSSWEIDRGEAAPSGEPLSGHQADPAFALVALCQTRGLATRAVEH